MKMDDAMSRQTRTKQAAAWNRNRKGGKQKKPRVDGKVQKLFAKTREAPKEEEKGDRYHLKCWEVK